MITGWTRHTTRGPTGWAALALATALLAGCGGGGGSDDTPDPPTPPVGPAALTLSSSAPVDNAATRAPVTIAPALTFSRAVDPSTATSSTVTLDGPAGRVGASVATSGATVTLTPSAPLAYAAAYTLTASTSLKATDGGSLAAAVTVRFQTEAAPTTLALTASQPADQATTPALVTVRPTLTFNKALDPASATAGNVSFTGPGGAVAATVSATGNTLTVVPQAALAYATSYTLTVAAGLRATDGTTLPSAVSIRFTTETQVLAAGCNGVTSGPVTLVSGKDNSPLVVGPTPQKGVTFQDPTYGTCLMRVTDSANEAGGPAFIRNDYSRRQAYNADRSLILGYSYNGGWHVYSGGPGAAFVATLPGPGGDAEPQWDPVNPDLLYYVPNNGGLVLYELNVRTGVRRTAADFTNRLPWSTTARVWTKSEGSPSADGRYWCFMAETSSFANLGVFTWDKLTDTILGTYATNGDRPDHLSMSPSGRHCVVSGVGTEGVVAFTRDLSQRFTISSRGEHSDIALGPTGNDVYVSIDYTSSGGDVYMLDLDTRVRTNLFPTYLNRTATAIHFSGKAFSKPGWVVVSTYSSYNADNLPLVPEWLHEKVFLVELKADPRLLMLAHTRRVSPNGWNVGDASYWAEPHATASRDLTRVLFNSNWGQPANRIEAYQIILPSTAVP